jgi:glycosyltransferase involved in cell wall biosynthesis
VVVCPGGLEQGGGIGRQMSYFLNARAGLRGDLRYEILDTRGPAYLGAAPLELGRAIIYFARSIARLTTMAGRNRSTLLHVNITGRGSTVRKVVLTGVARALRLPYLLHVHEPDYAAFCGSVPGPLRPAVRRVFAGAQTVLVLSERERVQLGEALSLPREHFVVAYNAVPDPGPVTNAVREAAHPTHIVFLGYLSERKGVPDLLRALASPAMAQREWRATLAGGGPVDSFRSMAEDLGLGERVHFPGWLGAADATRLCATSHVIVLPSYAEGLAMAVLEGLSHGLAVVTTPVGAHPEVIEPGRCGVFVPPGDPESLAAALARLIDDPQERKRLGAGARRQYLENFNVWNYAVRLQDLHASLLGQPGCGSSAPHVADYAAQP